MAKFDPAEIDAFSARDVLAAFGLPSRERGPCPLCLTSSASQAFVARGVFWCCFACGRSGNQVGLYAALGGITRGQAVRAIAQALGLSPEEGDYETLVAARAAREAARVEAARAERSASIRFRVAAWKLDYLRSVAARARTRSALSENVLGWLYREIGECEAVVLRDYPVRGWV